MLKLFTDTDTDVTPEIAQKYGYSLISMPYTVDGKDIYPYVDFDKFDHKAFYDMLRGGTIPSTSAISPAKYIEYFEPVFAAGDDILYVHFSAAMTATFGFMELALKELRERYPERKFYAVDTKGITLGSLNIVEEIGDMYLAGKTVEEILEWASTEVDKFAAYFYADDLKFFKKSGRVSGLAAVMGSLVGVRPIIYMDGEGKMVSVGKEIGRVRALARLVQYVRDLGDDVESHRVIITHSDVADIAEQLGEMLQNEFGGKLNIQYSVVNPTAGSHCGPNGVGVSFHAIHR